MLAVLGGLADVERDLIRTRTAEGRSRAKAQEKWQIVNWFEAQYDENSLHFFGLPEIKLTPAWHDCPEVL
jgi:hypothetical protein